MLGVGIHELLRAGFANLGSTGADGSEAWAQIFRLVERLALPSHVAGAAGGFAGLRFMILETQHPHAVLDQVRHPCTVALSATWAPRHCDNGHIMSQTSFSACLDAVLAFAEVPEGSSQDSQVTTQLRRRARPSCCV